MITFVASSCLTSGLLSLLGTRLGISEHIKDNERVYGFKLSDDDNAALEAVLDRSNGRRLISSIGDCGAEYR